MTSLLKTNIKMARVYIPLWAFFLFTAVAQATSATPESGSGSIFIENPLDDSIDNIFDFVNIILGAVVQVGVIVVACGIIYSGFLFVKAQGKPDQIKVAKEAIMYTIIGSAIVLGAFVILQIIQGTVGSLQ